MTQRYDMIVLGGGIMGSVLAQRLATEGQTVAVFDRGGLCMQASGVNAGTLSVQIKRTALIPYALRGLERWRNAGSWLGDALGFRQTGSLVLAFSDADAALLTERMTARQAQGAPIDIVSPRRARALEPGLSDAPVLASWCPIDGHASSRHLGPALRAALAALGVAVHEFTEVTALEPGDGETRVFTRSGRFAGTRIVVASGAWLERLLRDGFGVHIPITVRVNQVSVTERMPPVFERIIGEARGTLTLKRMPDGTVLIGGGWQGRGDLERCTTDLRPENLVGNLRLAANAVPALRLARVVRAWSGFEGATADSLPIAGPIPGHKEAYVLGCAKGGFTIGPYLAELLAERIQGREPELPLFDPLRLVRSNCAPLRAAG